MILGYARVSTDGQTLDAQQSALRQAGADRVFAEMISGATSDRLQLAKAIAALGEGDCLIVTKLDRLARSTRDLLNTLAAIADKGASFKSLGDAWANTSTPHGRLMLTVLGDWLSLSACPRQDQVTATAILPLSLFSVLNVTIK